MEKIKTVAMIMIGNFILALAVSVFVLPNHFISGGATGVALLINHYSGLEIASCVLVVNAVMFILGYLYLGKKFALTTILSTIIYPIFLNILMKWQALQVLNHNPLISCVLAGAFTGIGIGLVIRAGASTGGMDIPLLILNKRKNIAVAKTMYIMDTCILVLQTSFSRVDYILFGIIVVLVTSITINQVLVFGKKQELVPVLSH